MTLQRRHAVRLAAVAAAALLSAVPAAAMYCYIPEKQGAPFPLRDKPAADAKIVGRMAPGHMVRSVAKVRERNGFAYVDWFETQAARKPLGRGWANLQEIHGGECED